MFLILSLGLDRHNEGPAREIRQDASRTPALLLQQRTKRRWPVILSAILHGGVLALVPLTSGMLAPHELFASRVRHTINPVFLQVSDPARMKAMERALAAHRTLQSSASMTGTLPSRDQRMQDRHITTAGYSGRIHASRVTWLQAPFTAPVEALAVTSARSAPQLQRTVLGKRPVDLSVATSHAVTSGLSAAVAIAVNNFQPAPGDLPRGPSLRHNTGPAVGNRAPAQRLLAAIFALPPVNDPVTASATTPRPPGGILGRRMEHPPNGRFDVVIIQPSLPDNIPASDTVLTGRTVYTVYLQVGDTKEWVLHYAAGDAGTVQTGSVVTLGDPRPVSAPYPQLSVLPASVPASHDAFLFVHGLLDEHGVLSDLRVLGQEASQSGELLAALTEWRFRAARRGGEATRIEVLFAIPARQI